MKEPLEAVSSYMLACFMLIFSFTVDNASTILQLGGIALLIIRLYADGVRAYRTWRGTL